MGNFIERIKSNIYAMLIYRLIIIWLLYGVLRLLFYVVNSSLYPDIGFSHLMTLFAEGIRFDMSAILFSNSIYILLQVLPFHFRYSETYQKLLKFLFVFTNAFFFLFACADLVYFPFTFRRTVLGDLMEFSNDASNVGLIGSFIADYWWLLLLFVALVFVLIYTYGSINQKDWKPEKPLIYYLTSSLIFLLIGGLTFLGIRGGSLTGIPLAMNHATAKIKKPLETGIVLNTPFCLFSAAGQSSLKTYNYFPEEELVKIVNPVKTASDKGFTPKNVVIIMLEGFSKAHSEYMPFVNSLAEDGLSFKYSFANGLTSSDALPSILANIPALMPVKYVSGIYSGNRLDGIARQLSQKGYDCSFFHGAPRGSMRFLEFTRMLDFPNYYGQEDYGNDSDYDGHWGIWDESFLQYTANMMNEKQQPFLSVVFTLTSHHPFRIPEEYKDTFPEGELPIHKTIAYTDYSLRRFFETARQMPWFENTLFVLSADHTNGAVQEEYKTSVGLFAVPIIFYEPSGRLKHHEEKIMVQQIDIIPSILDYLNYDLEHFSFGSSVFSADSTHFLINYINNTYQVYQNNYVLRTNDDGAKGLYLLDTDPLLKHDLREEQPERTENMHNLYKAFVQQYNNRIVSNKTNILFE
ncbi:LTA synthase family protein [Paludibacter sp. 221]|uniref:LTA synthase family protein n=1 Tax=Paludibacter sp. 221 TaxID=2302939 RepID=UPI0013D4FD21|nr:LTA synthase family protein [Paludibacter sp. 221]NDV45779.1 LTA synthase family protein [Paludibacter sp. 221]